MIHNNARNQFVFDIWEDQNLVEEMGVGPVTKKFPTLCRVAKSPLKPFQKGGCPHDRFSDPGDPGLGIHGRI